MNKKEKPNTNTNGIPFPANTPGMYKIYETILVCDGTEKTREKLRDLVDDVCLFNEPVEIKVVYEIKPLKK